jgi:hypothetical protein
MNQPPITIRFTIKRDALLYDIENNAYVVGNLIPDTEQPTKHQLIDVAQEGNKDILDRALDLAYSECQNILFPYVKTPASQEDYRENTHPTEADYAFTLSVPASFANDSAIYLKKLIHEYMKCRALVEWTGLVFAQLQPSWVVKMEDVKSQIRQILNFRCKKVRRTLNPF